MDKIISIITINYNGLELTCNLLDSLRRNATNDLEIIVVDNGSKTDEAVKIAEKYPEVKTVRSEKNLGFAGGNNLGFKHSKGEFLFFINNDTIILEDKLDSMLEVFKNKPDVGIVCPKIRFWEGSRLIQFAGYSPMKDYTLKNQLKGFCKEDDGSFDIASESAFAHGAAMMVRRSAIEDVGLIPECYFLYYEELDWSMMFKRKGWKIMYEPSQTVFHKASASVGKESALRTYYMVRNRQIFAKRNYSGVKGILTIAFTRYLWGTKKLLIAMFQGRTDLVKAIIKANKDFEKGIATDERRDKRRNKF